MGIILIRFLIVAIYGFLLWVIIELPPGFYIKDWSLEVVLAIIWILSLIFTSKNKVFHLLFLLFIMLVFGYILLLVHVCCVCFLDECLFITKIWSVEEQYQLWNFVFGEKSMCEFVYCPTIESLLESMIGVARECKLMVQNEQDSWTYFFGRMLSDTTITVDFRVSPTMWFVDPLRYILMKSFWLTCGDYVRQQILNCDSCYHLTNYYMEKIDAESNHLLYFLYKLLAIREQYEKMGIFGL